MRIKFPCDQHRLAALACAHSDSLQSRIWFIEAGGGAILRVFPITQSQPDLSFPILHSRREINQSNTPWLAKFSSKPSPDAMPIRRMQSQELPSTAPAADNGDTQFLSKFTQIYADNVVLPPEGQPLYKDECVFTFETAESENGVYICLKRHFAISREALQDYIGFSQQNIFLHHRRTKRFLPDNTPKDENGQSKPKRMAIGVEGGFNPDGPAFEYEDHYTVALFPENAEIDYDITKLPTQLVSAIERIISAGSASRVVEATAQNATWDGEFRVISKHAENLPTRGCCFD